MQRGTATRPYHHGDLRDSLVDAGVVLARADGPEAVQLRAVTRAVGVSHNAAYRHFADLQDLVDAVAERCMTELADVMRTRIAGVRIRDRRRRAIATLDAIGRAYVDFALAEPGWFRTAFAIRSAHTGDAPKLPADVAADRQGPFEVLTAALDGLVEVGALPAARRPGAEHAAWSAVHGLATLLVDGPLRDLPPADRDRAVAVVLDVVRRGLTGAHDAPAPGRASMSPARTPDVESAAWHACWWLRTTSGTTTPGCGSVGWRPARRTWAGTPAARRTPWQGRPTSRRCAGGRARSSPTSSRSRVRLSDATPCPDCGIASDLAGR